MEQIDAVIDKRENQHGPFIETSRVIQNIKGAMRDSRNWGQLPHDQREALEMVAHKVGRILTGAGNSHDSWVDIAGYTTLVEEQLRPGAQEPDPMPLQACNCLPDQVCNTCHVA